MIISNDVSKLFAQLDTKLWLFSDQTTAIPVLVIIKVNARVQVAKLLIML